MHGDPTEPPIHNATAVDSPGFGLQLLPMDITADGVQPRVGHAHGTASQLFDMDQNMHLRTGWRQQKTVKNGHTQHAKCDALEARVLSCVPCCDQRQWTGNRMKESHSNAKERPMNAGAKGTVVGVDLRCP